MDISILFILLLYCIVPLGISHGLNCIRRCSCVTDDAEQDRLVISCKWPMLSSTWTRQSFAQFPLDMIKTLNIECDLAKAEELDYIELDGNLFSGFKNLQNLRIQGCSTHALPSTLLRGLDNLRSLYLIQIRASREQAFTLPNNFFVDNRRLEKLTVVDCNLVFMPESLFCDIPYIQVVNVSHNWLQSVRPGSTSTANVRKCTNLAEQLIIFDLRNNHIKTIESNDLTQLVAIRQLLLANNQIENINQDALRACTLLQQLHLENNSIKDLPVMPETLIHLDVAHNRLSTIPSTIANLPNLLSLNVSGNEIDASTPFSALSTALHTVDLSRNRLELIPENLLSNSLQQLQHLLLAYNKITRLEPLFFYNSSNLLTLDLTSNRIAEIKEYNLVGLSKLTQLYISYNSIHHVDITAFESTPKLQELHMSHNLLVEVPLALGRLFKIRQLDLSNNQISKTYKFLFNKLPHMQSLNFRKNKLSSIDSYVFSDMPRLTELDLSFNTINKLSENAFAKCPKLRHLDLSGNYLTNFNGAIKGLENLKRFNGSSNVIQLLQWNDFPTTTTHIELSHNQIAVVGTAVNSRIRHVQLQKNRIMTLTDKQIPNTVEYLNLSDNLIHTIGIGSFRSKPSISSLDLRNNQLSSLEINAFTVDALTTNHPVKLFISGNPLACSCEMDWIRSSKERKSLINIVDGNQTTCIHRIHNQQIRLSEVERRDLLCTYKQICEPNCICCQYGNCDCKSKCPNGCNCYHDATYTTNIVRCSALSSEDRKNFSPKDMPMYATNIYLENMNIPVIRSHDFLGRTRLLHLHLNHSSVREIQPLAFNTLPSLRLLDLSGNHLVRLTGDELYRTNKITTLLLHDNQLTSLGNRLNEVMPQLEKITLHNNRLQDLPTSIEQFGKQLTAITLGSNAFRCDCSTRFHAQFWLSRHLDLVRDVSEIFCLENVSSAIQENDTTILSAYPPNYGKDIFRISMTQFIATANTTICTPTASSRFGTESAKSTFFIIIVLFAPALITVVFVILSVLFLKKTKSAVIQRRYKVPPSFTGSNTTPGPSPLPLIHFDAFISYSKKDEKFINDTLCRQLESEEYILCMLHRDGPNYSSRVHAISDELINQMECAQSLILVLTRHFLENEWKTLQIKTSHQIFAKNRHKKMIALLGDGIEPNQLEAELGQILRKNTCIRMSDPLFWNLLHSALPVRIIPSSCSGGSSQIYSDCYGNIVPSDII